MTAKAVLFSTESMLVVVRLGVAEVKSPLTMT